MFPAEDHHVSMGGALPDLPTADIPEHERNIVLGIHLQEVAHPLSAARALGIPDSLRPTWPSAELVAAHGFAKVEVSIFREPFEGEGKGRTLDAAGVVFLILVEHQTQALEFLQERDIWSFPPPRDGPARKTSRNLRRYSARRRCWIGLDNADKLRRDVVGAFNVTGVN